MSVFAPDSSRKTGRYGGTSPRVCFQRRRSSARFSRFCSAATSVFFCTRSRGGTGDNGQRTTFRREQFDDCRGFCAWSWTKTLVFKGLDPVNGYPHTTSIILGRETPIPAMRKRGVFQNCRACKMSPMQPGNENPGPTPGLAIETSGTVGSVALGRGGDLLETRVLDGDSAHAAELLPTIESLCQTHAVQPFQISTVLVSIGPGSFTGLRIGATVARMIALAGGARLVAVPSLEVIAQNALEVDPVPDRTIVILDAKRGRVFGGSFNLVDRAFVPDGAPAEVEPAEFLAAARRQEKRCIVLGSGVEKYGDVVRAGGLNVLERHLHRPRAEAVYRLGMIRAEAAMFTEPRNLVPCYIRLPDAEEKWRERQADSSEIQGNS